MHKLLSLLGDVADRGPHMICFGSVEILDSVEIPGFPDGGVVDTCKQEGLVFDWFFQFGTTLRIAYHHHTGMDPRNVVCNAALGTLLTVSGTECKTVSLVPPPPLAPICWCVWAEKT